MSTEEHIAQLTAQIAALQAQLARCSWSPPPPQPSTAPPPPKPPKVSTPSPFSGAQDDLDHFKAECSLYLSMRQSEFLDEHSNVLFVLSYMKGGSAGPCQSMTLHIKLRASPMHLRSSSMYSDALCIRLRMLRNSALPPASVPLHMPPLLVCLFVCLPLSPVHMLLVLFVCFPFRIDSIN